MILVAGWRATNWTPTSPRDSEGDPFCPYTWLAKPWFVSPLLRSPRGCLYPCGSVCLRVVGARFGAGPRRVLTR